MPAPNLGLVGAYGAKGVQDAIQEMVAERRAAEKLAFEQAIANRRAAVEEQNAKTNEFEALARLRAARAGPSPIQLTGLAPKPGETPGAYKGLWDPATREYLLREREEPDAASAGSSAEFERFRKNDLEPWLDAQWTAAGNTGQRPKLTPDEIVKWRLKHSAYAPSIQQGTFGPMATTNPERTESTYLTGPDKYPIGRPIDAATVKRLTDIASVEQAAQNIQKIYRPEWVGAIIGRKNELLLNTPDAFTPDQLAKITPEMAQMNAWLGQMRNSLVVKLTGLAATDQQMASIMSEIPAWSDEPINFQAKMQKTIENDRLLDREIKRLSGAAVGAGADLPPGFKLPQGVTPPGGAGGTQKPPSTFFPGNRQTPATEETMRDQIKPYTNRKFIPVLKEGVWWGKDEQGNWVQVDSEGKFIIGR